MSKTSRVVIGAVDTYKDVHVAAVTGGQGRILGTGSFPVSGQGYEELREWLCGHGEVAGIGVEGTGSYGAGLARHLRAAGIKVPEVNRPDRQMRRRGKSGTVDAGAAARAVLCGEVACIPKSAEGAAEALRALRVARRSAVKARTQAGDQIRDLIVSAPMHLRAEIGQLSLAQQVTRCARWRTGPVSADAADATRRSLRLLARRHQALTAEIAELDQAIATVCAQASPALLAAA